MKQILILILIALFYIGCPKIYSQKEADLSNPKSDDVKVESLKGFELRLIPYSNGVFLNQVGLFAVRPFSLSVYAGYLNEKRIAPRWTLLLTAGLHNVINQSPVLRSIYDPVDHFNTRFGPDTKTNYSLLLEVGVEPRWYKGTKKWYKEGNSQLNSGWFISFPLIFQTLILHTPEPYIGKSWFPEILYSGSFILTPTVGYRQAISGRLFVEGSIGYGANVTVCTNSVDNRITVLDPEYNPVFKLKGAYTLK
ncbi:MAG: hypothetical protein PHT07_13355 [Paludibacter sp.]|nr:hypothetical protein [Paludibacter sp.]